MVVVGQYHDFFHNLSDDSLTSYTPTGQIGITLEVEVPRKIGLKSIKIIGKVVFKHFAQPAPARTTSCSRPCPTRTTPTST